VVNERALDVYFARPVLRMIRSARFRQRLGQYDLTVTVPRAFQSGRRRRHGIAKL